MPTVKNLAAKDPEVLLRRIKAGFPELTWQAYTFLDHGWDHEVIILDNKLVFRFPNSSEYLAAFKDEAKLLAYIHTKTRTPIPNYTYVAQDVSFGGYEIVHGIEFTATVFQGLTVKQQQSVAGQIANFLTALHTIPLEDLKQFNVSHENSTDDFKKLRQRAGDYLPAVLSSNDYRVAITILESVEKWATGQLPKTLTHGDIASAHLLWNEATEHIGVIDFSDRSISDPAGDFAELYAYGEAFIKTVYAQYTEQPDDTLLKRAKDYYKRIGVYLMVDSFLTDKITFEDAKVVFDRTKHL